MSVNNVIRSEYKINVDAKGEYRTLFFDFDETLGSFHPYYSVIYRVLKIVGIPKTKCDNILKDILKSYCLRVGIRELLTEIKTLKNLGLIKHVIVLSSNSANYSTRGDPLDYFINTVDYIEEIYDVKGLFYQIKFNVRTKELIYHIPDHHHDSTLSSTQTITFLKTQKVYIIDDKCKSIIPEIACIGISPYYVYLLPKLSKTFFKKHNINSESIDDMLEKYHTDNPDYSVGYPQIPREQFVIEEDKIIINNDIEEITRIIVEIRENYE